MVHENHKSGVITPFIVTWSLSQHLSSIQFPIFGESFENIMATCSIVGINSHYPWRRDVLVHMIAPHSSHTAGKDIEASMALEGSLLCKARSYKTGSSTLEALQKILAMLRDHIPVEFLDHVRNVNFLCHGDTVLFPTPFQELEAASSIKAIEGCAVAAIADLRYGASRPYRRIEVDLDRVACFLMSAYMTSIDGMGKGDSNIKNMLPDTDLNQAQSILYRRLSANLYETATPGEYYHIHGSLEASATLQMLGLPSFNPILVDYRDCIDTIEAAVKTFSVPELEVLNATHRQAGVPVLTWDQFIESPHGRAVAKLPPFTVQILEDCTPPVPFSALSPAESPQLQSAAPLGALTGIKVLELCRVLAGPTIGRSLAAHGADVLKVTSPDLPDVPFFQIEVNAGKHTTALDLRDPADRRTFDVLLEDADVFIDGYRPGALERLGYGRTRLASLAKARGKGFVYVAEDCFGGSGGVPGAEWAGRPGWQQIADCVTGLAWEQGKFMGVNEPVVPPFPMSDYGTGAVGCCAALVGLYRRAKEGGSFVCRTSLAQYDTMLMGGIRHGVGGLDLLPREVQERARKMHDQDFFALRHADSVDEVGSRAVQSMRRCYPRLFGDSTLRSAWSTGFDAEVRWPREPVAVQGLWVGPLRASRPNGFDAPSWEEWEVDEDVMIA